MPLIVQSWPQGQSRAVVFNSEAAYFFLTDRRYREDALAAPDVYCDGAGVVLYALFRYGRLIRRRQGPELLTEYLAERKRAKVLLIGGVPTAHEGLRRRWPHFYENNHVVVDDSMIAEGDFDDKARAVVAEGYDDVLIFFGLAKQERFQCVLHDHGFAGSTIGLGAAIDFLSGNKKASGWLWRRLGLGWLPRLLREPRMWPRVVRSFAVFGEVANSNNPALKAYLFGPSK